MRRMRSDLGSFHAGKEPLNLQSQGRGAAGGEGKEEQPRSLACLRPAAPAAQAAPSSSTALNAAHLFCWRLISVTLSGRARLGLSVPVSWLS